eukprot:Em0648g5a
MTHNQERAGWLREGLIGLSVGVLYGTTRWPLVIPLTRSRPRCKPRRDLKRGACYVPLPKRSENRAIIGLYRGCLPPLIGSGIYRATHFAVFESLYTLLNNPIGTFELPMTGGLQARVVLAGVTASCARAIIESPLEYAKVRRQTQQKWKLRHMYRGFGSGYGPDESVVKRMRRVVKERGGFFALYRGIGPGTIRSFLANGTSMVVMQHAQRKISEWGLRD